MRVRRCGRYLAALTRISFSSRPPHRLRSFIAALNVVVAEEQALAAVWPNGAVRAFKAACTRIEARATVPLTTDRGSESPATLQLVYFCRS
jgi:hypothetical protein